MFFGRLHDGLSARANGRCSQNTNGRDRERWAIRCSGLCEGLVGTPTLTRTEASARDERRTPACRVREARVVGRGRQAPR